MKCVDFLCYQGMTEWCKECSSGQREECKKDSQKSSAVVLGKENETNTQTDVHLSNPQMPLPL